MQGTTLQQHKRYCGLEFNAKDRNLADDSCQEPSIGFPSERINVGVWRTTWVRPKPQPQTIEP
jgi:hypothetical protein